MAVGMECHDGGVGGMGIKNNIMVDVVVSQDQKIGGHVEFVLECRIHSNFSQGAC